MWLQASLLSRLDRLGASREVAEIASAIGRHFSADLLTLVVSQPERLEASLEALIAAGIVQRLAGRPSEFTFRHALIRDAAYRIMVKERRLAIHGRIVTAIEASFPEVVAQHPDILALHCAEAGLARQAALYWLKAGHAALRRSAMQEALIHLRHGIEVLPKDESEDGRTQLELDLTIALGKAQIATQGYAIPSTGETFARAGQLCARLGTPPQTLAVLHGLWTHSLMRAELDSARQQARALLQRGEQGGNRMQLLMGNRFCGVTSHPLGEFAEATRLLEAGLELYDPLQQAIYWALTVDDPRVIMLDLPLVVADVPRPRVGCAQQQPARDQRGARHGACVHPGACARRRVLRDDDDRAAAGRLAAARRPARAAGRQRHRLLRRGGDGAARLVPGGGRAVRALAPAAGRRHARRIGPPRRGSTCRASCAWPPRPMAGRGGFPPRSN